MKSIPLRNKNYFYNDQIILPDVEITNVEQNNQILHYITANRDIANHESTKKFVFDYLSDCEIFACDADVLTYALSCINKNLEGYILEFGVCTGKTINIIAALNSHSLVYGFDSFDGLPEDWRVGAGKNTFKIRNKKIPPLLANVDIYEGYFEETLPQFLIETPENSISFIHMDCDLYSSTKTVLNTLKKRIKKGTFILFDEYFNYDGWEDHEHKAFVEFIDDSGLSFEYVAYNKYHEQVLIKII
jgi:hypothetical protein